MADTMTVLFATDRPLVRAGLRAVLAEAPGLRLAGEATTGEETRRLCQAVRPTVVLLDPRLTDPPALETIAALRRDCPAARVVVLAPPGAIEAMRALVALGAAGAVSLDDTPATVVQAIQMVGQGGAWLSRPLLAALARGAVHAGARLTTRQREVLAFLAAGRRNAEIAEALSVSVRTVEYHVGHLLDKLDAETRTEAVHRARERGLLGDDSTADE